MDIFRVAMLVRWLEWDSEVETTPEVPVEGEVIAGVERLGK